jgi:membrane fusion protein (multidrug efflux system)
VNIRVSLIRTFASLIAMTIVAGGCAKHEEAATEKGPENLPVVDVVSKILYRNDQIPGEIQPYQDVMIYPKVPGFVKWIGVDRGSIVKKGQLMVVMEAPEYLARRNESLSQVSAAKAKLSEGQAKLDSAIASLREAKARVLSDDSTYQRIKAASLVPGVVATNEVVVLGQTVDEDKQRVDSWQKNVNAAGEQVAALEENLSAAKRSADNFADFAAYLEIKAPFDGYIVQRNMHVGSFVGPNGEGAYPAICRIQQLNLLRVVAPVPERDVSGVLPGAKVAFSVSTHPGEKFNGTVARLGNYLEQKTRTMPVELDYYNADNRILPGMFCEVIWPTRRPQPSLFVPITSVVTTTLDTFVCLVRNNIVEWVKVKKGQTMDGMVEIFGDIHEGDLVAKIGTDELQPGTQVNAQKISTQESQRPAPDRPKYESSSFGS